MRWDALGRAGIGWDALGWTGKGWRRYELDSARSNYIDRTEPDWTTVKWTGLNWAGPRNGRRSWTELSCTVSTGLNRTHDRTVLCSSSKRSAGPNRPDYVLWMLRLGPCMSFGRPIDRPTDRRDLVWLNGAGFNDELGCLTTSSQLEVGDDWWQR